MPDRRIVSNLSPSCEVANVTCFLVPTTTSYELNMVISLITAFCIKSGFVALRPLSAAWPHRRHIELVERIPASKRKSWRAFLP